MSNFMFSMIDMDGAKEGLVSHDEKVANYRNFYLKAISHFKASNVTL